MRKMRVTNKHRGVLLGTQVKLADRWWPRMRGFLGRPEPKEGEGLLLTPCNAVHMYGMRFSLDVVFLDDDGVVVALYEELRPGKRTKVETKAKHALELPAGTIRATGTVRGDRIAWLPAEARGAERSLNGGRPVGNDLDAAFGNGSGSPLLDPRENRGHNDEHTNGQSWSR